MDYDVAVIGGGNAALCAALAARDAGARVVILERAPREMRGGNTRHVRNLRDAHRRGDRFVTGPYLPEEFLADIRSVTGDEGDPHLTELLVTSSLDIAAWAWDHGIRWQMPLRGTLSLSRTNRFFLGGGKSLINAYYQTAARNGIAVRYDATVTGLEIDGSRCTALRIATPTGEEMVRSRAVIVAAGGFEANRDWLRRYWGDAADNFAVRGTPLNDGGILALLFSHGATPVADPTRFHGIAVDARAPMHDAGILSRLDAIPYGIVVDREGRRFYDEGEDIWPKRYAIWGRLIAEQPGQVAFVLLDARSIENFMPPLYPPVTGATIGELATRLGLPSKATEQTIATYNESVVAGTFREGELDDCRTVGLAPPKSHWARPIDMPPFYGFPLRTGITFTYHGVRIDGDGRVRLGEGRFENVYAAGEIMAGNVLTRGYLAGIGMTIGSVFGRHAGRAAARHLGFGR